jgi:trigger factor
MKRQLLDTLDDAHQFEIPQGMVTAELEGITSQIEQERKANPESEELTDEEKDELSTIAERRVRLGLVIAEIGQQNNVQINDQELQRSVITEAQKYPGQEKMVFEFYQKNPQMLENLRAPLFEDKVVDIIFEGAEITEKEVSIEELMKDDEDEALAKKSKSSKKAVKKAPAKKAAKKADKK